MVSPSGRVPEWDPDWFFAATEAFSDGTSDLGFFSEVSIFIRFFGIENKSWGCLRGRQALRAPPPPGARLAGLWTTCPLPGLARVLRGSLLVH